MKTDFLQGKCLKFELVGSRITCNPAPTDTDQDVLVLADLNTWGLHLEPLLVTGGFEKGGSDCGDSAGYMGNTPLSFQSFTFGELNLIVTFDPEFYRRFMAATAVSKSLNLLDKTDRVMLFQAVLYGNGPVVEQPVIPFDLPPPAPYVRSWWVELEKVGSKCVETYTAEMACQIAEDLTGFKPLGAEQLPYPAEPRLNPYVQPHLDMACPSFCYSPEACKGRSCCPQRISCTE